MEKNADRPSILGEALEAGLKLGLPGISLAVSSSSGKKQLIAGEGIDHDSVFCIGSITKPCVAIVVLQLVSEGKLDLDESTASKYVSHDILSMLRRIPNATTATIRHLLSHQSGIPTWEFHPQWIKDARGACVDPNTCWSSARTLDYLLDTTSSTGHPGECYSYSNTNYTILGHIIEGVTGNAIQDELRDRIWKPLGLMSAVLCTTAKVPSTECPSLLYHYVTPTFRRDAGVPLAYFDAVTESQLDPNLMETSRGTNLSCEWTAGGVCMTMADLHTFGVALQQRSLLTTEMSNAMMTFTPPQSDTIAYNGLGEAKTSLRATGEEYCLGLCRTVEKDIWHHGGLTLSFSSRLMLLPGGTVVACATNVGIMHSGFSEGESPWDKFLYDMLLPAVKRNVSAEASLSA